MGWSSCRRWPSKTVCYVLWSVHGERLTATAIRQIYLKEVEDIARPGSYMGIWQVHAIASISIDGCLLEHAWPLNLYCRLLQHHHSGSCGPRLWVGSRGQAIGRWIISWSSRRLILSLDSWIDLLAQLYTEHVAVHMVLRTSTNRAWLC